MVNEEVLLELKDSISYFHDARIIDIKTIDNEMILYFDDSRFYNLTKVYKSAQLIFTGFEDFNSDIFVDLFSMRKCKITHGKRLYFYDFIKFFHKQKIKLELVDLYISFGKVIIKGVCVKKRIHTEKNFNYLFVLKK